MDLEGVGITRPNLTGLPTTMVRSYWELGDILHFDPATARRNIELGYYDTLRAFGRVRGCAYAVDNGPDSSADAEAFRAAFDAVQKAVREKYPVTLTADLPCCWPTSRTLSLPRWKPPPRMWAWTRAGHPLVPEHDAGRRRHDERGALLHQCRHQRRCRHG